MKFRSRLGEDALRFVSRRESRHLNLRGIYMQAAEPGVVRPGDPMEVIERSRDLPA